jgi:predicted DCC family thiol-disulfide oxidoreductase YuxK
VRALTVLYDPGCPLCLRCRDWMASQPTFVRVEFLPCDAPEATRRFGTTPWRGDQLLVVADTGEAWLGPSAFLMCLWALRNHRAWAYRLASPALAPLAARFFHALSARRHRLAAWLGWRTCESRSCALGDGPRMPQSAYR